MGGPQPLGTPIISSGKQSHKVWLYLCMNKDGLFRRLPPQDSAEAWVNLVLTFPGPCKMEACSGPSQLRAQAVLSVPKLWGQHGRWRGGAKSCWAK